MQVNQVSALGSAAGRGSAVTLGPQWVGDFSGGGPGPLSKKEIAMIKDVTGMDFNWPATPNVDGYPKLALDIANAHADQAIAKSKIEEFTSAAMLSKLHLSKVITNSEMSKGLAFLKAHPASDGDSTPSAPSALRPGAVAGDGSVYL